MAGFIDFVSQVIYGTGAEVVITPNHQEWTSSNPSPTGLDWITRHVDGAESMLGVYEAWLATNRLPPIYPWSGVRFSEDPDDEANATGRALPASLNPTNLTATTLDALGASLRNRLTSLQTASPLAGDLQDAVKAPYSHRFWGYLKWASLIVRRWRGELVDFDPPILYDRDGTILSAVPFLDSVNHAHWRWHDFDRNINHHGLPLTRVPQTYSPPGAITPNQTPGQPSSVGQKAGPYALNLPSPHDRISEEFLYFHRQHVQMFHNWLARQGQGEQASINMITFYDPSPPPPPASPADEGWPPGNPSATPSAWTPATILPWANSPAQEAARTGGSRLRNFSTRAALAGNAMGAYHGRGHNANRDIRHPFRNNFDPRFFTWHGYIDDQWYFREPRFGRWNAAARLRERFFRPVLTGNAAWPGLPALTIVRGTASDTVSPTGAVGGLDLATGAGSLAVRLLANDTWSRQLRLDLAAEVFQAGSAAPVATATPVSVTIGPGGAQALDTEFTSTLAFADAFRSSDPGRTQPAVRFVNSRIRVTGTLTVADGSDPGFVHTDFFDIDLVQEQDGPAIDLFLNLSSFGESQVQAQPLSGGQRRFAGAAIVAVQDRTQRATPIAWPTLMSEELKNLLAPRVPAAGLFGDAAHAPQPAFLRPGGTPFTGVRFELASGPVKEDPALPENLPQRYTYTYDAVFDDPTDAFTGLAIGAQQFGTLRMTAADRCGNAATSEAQVKLFRDANPFMTDGDPAWLSRDTRALRVFVGDSVFGVTLAAGQPTQFLQALAARLNDPAAGTAAVRDGWFDSLPTFGGQDVLEYSPSIRNPSTGATTPLYNFALARVRIRGAAAAARVRVFFRLFSYTASNLVFDPNVGYRTHVDGARKVPLLGFSAAGQTVSIPFFANPRQAATGMRDQPEDGPTNVFDFPGGAQEEHRFFGAYLDINQPSSTMPAQRIAGHEDGPFTAAEVQPIRDLIRDAHQCMVAEIHYDGDATRTGDTPFTSDNLAQRNLAILWSDNPGSPITRTVQHSFEADTGRRHPGPKDPAEERDMPALLAEAAGTRWTAAARAPDHFTHVADDHEEGRAAGGDTGIAAAGRGTDRTDRAAAHGHHAARPPRTAATLAHGVAGHGHGPAGHGPPADGPGAFVFDAARWSATHDAADELLFLWNGLPRDARVEVYLPEVRAEAVANLRSVRHAPGNVSIVDEHTLRLEPVGAVYLPLPPTPGNRVNGVVTITLPDGVKHGQSWPVDVLQLRGSERRAMGAFRLEVRVGKDLPGMAEAERRLLAVLFERRSLLPRSDRWFPILDRRVRTARARARAFAERAKVPWVDPTLRKDDRGGRHGHDDGHGHGGGPGHGDGHDHGEGGHGHAAGHGDGGHGHAGEHGGAACCHRVTPDDPSVPAGWRELEGPRLRVVLDKVEVVRDFDPWIKGRGEFVFVARVTETANGGTSRTRLPAKGHLKVSDKDAPGVLDFGAVLFDGHAEGQLTVELVATEKDLLDPDDWAGKYCRVFTGCPEDWFGAYRPGQSPCPEDVGPFRVHYRIERGGGA